MSACADMTRGDPPPPANEQYVRGTWSVARGMGEEVFLASHAYCTFSSANSDTAYSRGTWDSSQDGIASVIVTYASDPRLITPSGAAELRVVRRTGSSGLL